MFFWSEIYNDLSLYIMYLIMPARLLKIDIIFGSLNLSELLTIGTVNYAYWTSTNV